MRALGLPNTKHFHEITRIEDALACMYMNYNHSLTLISDRSGGEVETRRQTRDIRTGNHGGVGR